MTHPGLHNQNMNPVPPSSEKDFIYSVQPESSDTILWCFGLDFNFLSGLIRSVPLCHIRLQGLRTQRWAKQSPSLCSGGSWSNGENSCEQEASCRLWTEAEPQLQGSPVTPSPLPPSSGPSLLFAERLLGSENLGNSSEVGMAGSRPVGLGKWPQGRHPIAPPHSHPDASPWLLSHFPWTLG